MRASEHVDRLEAEAAAFVDVVAAAELGLPITPCPGWTTADVARHVGGLYRWVVHLLGDGVTKETWRAQLPIEYPDESQEWAPWLREAATELVHACRAVDPDLPVWSWGHDQHARSWPRRMLYETVIHRADIEISAGVPVLIDGATAAEGIEELLDNLRYSARWNPAIAALHGAGEKLVLATGDPAGPAWRIRLAEHGWFWDRGTRAGDAVVTGPPDALLLFLYRRVDAAVASSGTSSVTIDGDQSVVARWQAATEF